MSPLHVRQMMKRKCQFLDQAKQNFAFLESLGFRLSSEREGTYASFKNGFDVRYSSEEVALQVAYYDMELEITFKRGDIEASYLFLDHNLRGNASGWAGHMFPHDKLAPAIEKAARDIESNYEPILRGDSTIWTRIEKLVHAPRESKRQLP